MQDTKRFKTNIRRRGRGGQVHWGPALRNGGEEEQGYSEGLLEASHAGMVKGIGIIKMWWG
jgi:hypothetical protein